ncbi:zinc finger FYVE domain-containing protein 9-like [Sinocyclocheilus rhinocerous]|uniref:zinc finger FYVE domain-containing protein 9-like n=1 Tax=Sinocyclocheilus rhinocerous TaxID=307959 RepID=UPI0007B8F006|nr:PREDICTED: zinc finger FYVE domain-containing protein 9-like [Sinocyclocheilus rhinocerous]
MENYFQAEAFNLDKVLDEFEQNEDETDTPTLSDAKWTQILAPPSHLLSLNPALTHSNLSPRDSPISFKPLLDAQTSDGLSLAEVTRLDGKQGVGQQPEGRSEERPADVHSPPLPQPNIGKLVSTDGQLPDLPSSNRVVLENGYPSSPDLSDRTDVLPVNEDETCQTVTDEQSVKDTGPREFKIEQNGTNEGSGGGLQDFTVLEEQCGNGPPVLNNGVKMEASQSDSGSPVREVGVRDCNLVFPEGSNPQKGEAVLHKSVSDGGELDCERENHEGAFQNGGLVENEMAGKDTWASNQEEKEKTIESDHEGMHRESESSGAEKSLSNGLIVDLGGDAQSQSAVPSKEDSVTEEKEMEESKQECCDSLRGLESGRMGKLNNSRLQPVSVPYGGARPKQPVSLKLQIPQPFSSQVQNEFGSTGKNKNLEPQSRTGGLEASCGATESGVVRMNGEHGDSFSGLLIPSESPDNDLQAGQQLKKPFNSLGEVAPVWVPDSQAPICMKCEVKFTFTKRRHHCRACGKVFCAACCSLKSRLMYMDRKEARVCVTCHRALMNAQAWENMGGGGNQSPNPNNPSEYCSTIPPLQQAQASGALCSPPPTVMVPVGVLKQPGSEGSVPREQRRVWFADGILPNGEATDSSKGPAANPNPTQPVAASQYSNKSSGANASEAARATGAPMASPVGSSLSLIPEDGLPPILISTGVKGDYAVEERPSEIVLMQQLEEGGPDPLVFVLNANLLAMVKLVNCESHTSFCAGNVLSHLGHSFFTQSFLGSKEHGGFLYISPTFQTLQDLPLPNPPYLFGILVQKWETPWAKVFPIRLMLRLGAEYRFYPCPLFSVRFRKPLFGETGHTIMNLLADFRNYQYTLPVVKGLVVDMEVRKTCIKIPSNRYNELMKAMNKSNEHVLAMGACFNERADSHLVCVQNDDGNYQTQAISIHHQPRKVTGASFFVFSGALKSSSGYLAKTSIVEDGVMVQITAETMEALRQALREMKDFRIACGKTDQEENQEHVHIQWVDDDHNVNKGVISPIDGKSMESVTSVKIFHGSEYKANGKVIRWTEVFFLRTEDQTNGLSDPADHSQLAENVARAFCMALCPHLKLLKEDGMAKLGLRVTLDSDQVGYLAGSNGQPLLPQYLSDLDSALIPVIHSGACQLSEGPVVMELIFYILEIIS